MTDPTSERFDCVQSMREIRDKLSAEIADMSYEELSEWLRGRKYSDSFLQRLADRAAQQADTADPAPPHR